MIMLILLAAILVLTALLLAVAIRVRFLFEKSEKSIYVSYTIIGVLIDIASKRGRLALAGIPIYKFDLKREKKKPVAEKPAKKRKKKKRFGLSDLKLEYLGMAKSLIGEIGIEELTVNIRGGFLEPFYTGKMYGYYCAAKGIYPSLMSHIDFTPDFSSSSLEFKGQGVAYIRMYYILKFGFGLLADRLKTKTRELFVIRKRGASYG